MSKKIDVSDHAIVRYFERVLGYNIKEIKKKILPDPFKTVVNKFGNGKYPIGSHHVIVEGGRVVTIYGEKNNASPYHSKI